ARAHAGETRIGQHRDVLAEAEVLESAGDFVDFFHAGAHRSAANEDDDVARLDALRAAALDGGDDGALAGEDTCRADLAIDAVGVDGGRIDGGALDDGTFGGDVAARERHGRGQAAVLGPARAHDDVVWIDAILLRQEIAQAFAALGRLPPVERFGEWFAGR